MHKLHVDLSLVVVALLLVVIGVTMVHSASTVLSGIRFHDNFFYVKKQLLFASLGTFLMFVLARLDYRKLQRVAGLLFLLSLVFLVLVLVPHIGQVRGGSRAWLGIGAFGLQPSEFAKFSLILYLSAWFARYPMRVQSLIKGFLPPLLITGVTLMLIILEPDLGQSAVIGMTIMVMLYFAGARLRHMGSLVMIGLAAFVGLILMAPYRLSRVVAFLNPWQYPDTIGYHIIMSLIALGRGGLLGVGLFHSTQKFSYLPEPQTDFIFAIITEELGMVGAVFVLVLFLFLLYRGMLIAMRSTDRFGMLLAAGLTTVIAVQVIINVGVVTSLMPVTGITLPFISYGGSSLTLMLCAVGVLLSIARQSRIG